jgi:glucose/mannose transport system substrate-binding protein
MKRMSLLHLGLLVILALTLVACQPVATEMATEMPAEAEGSTGEVEIFSWWSSGGELAGLFALIDVYNAENPDVEVVNAAIGGGDGVNMKVVLETRMLGGEPPDAFQVWAGAGIIEDHVIPGRMEPIDSLYEEMGLYDLFPQSVIDRVSYDGKPYVVPVNIHHGNVMWYRPDRLAEVGVEEPPVTWDEFFDVAEKLKAAGIPAIGFYQGSGPAHHWLGHFLVSVFDGESYLGLFDGSTGWDDPRVTEALEHFNRTMDYTFDDYLAVERSVLNDRFVGDFDETPAMFFMGDWFYGDMKAKEFEGFRWASIPGHQGKYVWIADSFGLPKGAPNRDNAIAWLRVLASREGQDAFNPNKGSIPVRSDPDVSLYDEYLQSSMEEWQTLELIPFVGAMAKLSFVTDFGNIGLDFMNHRDVARAQAALVQAAEDAGFGE